MESLDGMASFGDQDSEDPWRDLEKLDTGRESATWRVAMRHRRGAK